MLHICYYKYVTKYEKGAGVAIQVGVSGWVYREREGNLGTRTALDLGHTTHTSLLCFLRSTHTSTRKSKISRI